MVLAVTVGAARLFTVASTCLCFLSCVHGEAAEAVIPRVALLFITRGHVPLENVWREFFRSVEGLQPPPLTVDQLAVVMEEERVKYVKQKLRDAGRLTPNSLLRDQECVDNFFILEAADELGKSWLPNSRNHQLPSRGAKLKDPSAAPHPLYESQSLFSVYVHAAPGFEGFSSSSVFHGREIEPSMAAPRFTHSLGKLALLLLEAALYDNAVHNARFVVVSDADVPIYNPAAIYMLLMRSCRSRTGPYDSYESILRSNHEFGTASPLMFVRPFKHEHLKKYSQWVTLTRAAAVVVVHDEVVEPWFETFSESRWRCKHVAEALQILPAAAKLLHESRIDLREHSRGLIQLRRFNLLSGDFSAGGFYDGLLPKPRNPSESSGRWRHAYGAEGLEPLGVPVWASELRTLFMRWWQGTSRTGLRQSQLTPEQLAALFAYRNAYNVRAPTWVFLPYNTGQTAARINQATHWHDVTMNSNQRKLYSGAANSAGFTAGSSQLVLGATSENLYRHQEAMTSDAPKSIGELLEEPVRLERREELVQNLPWPFPYCQNCSEDIHTQPWGTWSLEVQHKFLHTILPSSAACVSSVVSDECLINSILSFYDLSGPEWQTYGPSSHVDWGRQTGGHPGTYTREMLQKGPDVVRKRVRGEDCDERTQATYTATKEFFNAATDSNHEGNTAHLWAISGSSSSSVSPELQEILPERCSLFARKFQPDTADELHTWYLSCAHLGLHSTCLDWTTSRK